MTKEQNHYTEEDIALLAEAMQNNTFTDLPEAFRKHLHHCDICADEVMMVSSMIKSVPDGKGKKEKPNLTIKLLVISSIAAAAVIILILMIIPPPFSGGRPGQNKDEKIPSGNQAVENTDKQNANNDELSSPDEVFQPDVPAPINENEKDTDQKDNKASPATPAAIETPLPANYTSHQDLEQRVDYFRGTFSNTGSVEITTPTLIDYPGQRKLNWVNNQNQLLTIEIRNNSNVIIHRAETTSNTHDLPPLSPGLYYWKLISADSELLYAGKIMAE